MYKQLLAVTAIATILIGCGGKKDEKWTGFIYPSKENTKRSVKSPITFNTLEECQVSSKKQLTLMKLEETGVYKCGLNCEFHDGMKLEICEQMVSPATKASKSTKEEK